MEIYDYTENADTINCFMSKIDTLSEKQVRKINNMMIQLISEEQACADYHSWFDTFILPILQNFAETMMSVLRIKRDETGVLAEVLHEHEIELPKSFKGIWMVIAAAEQLSFSQEEGKNKISFVFEQEQ